ALDVGVPGGKEAVLGHLEAATQLDGAFSHMQAGGGKHGAAGHDSARGPLDDDPAALADRQIACEPAAGGRNLAGDDSTGSGQLAVFGDDKAVVQVYASACKGKAPVVDDGVARQDAPALADGDVTRHRH